MNRFSKPLHVLSWSAYEKAMKDAKIRVAIDAGANEGDYTRTLVEKGFEVWAFEPQPVMFRKLFERHWDKKGVWPINMGLGNHVHILKDVQILECWSIGKPGDGGMLMTPNLEVQRPFDMLVTTIDHFFSPRRKPGDGGVGIIKLDTDGFEYKVLKGGEQTIRKWKPAILCEFGEYLERLGDDPKTFIEFIFDLGYDIWSMDGLNKFSTWKEIEPQYPHSSTFDVMLLPR